MRDKSRRTRPRRHPRPTIHLHPGLQAMVDAHNGIPRAMPPPVPPPAQPLTPVQEEKEEEKQADTPIITFFPIARGYWISAKSKPRGFE